MTQAYPLHWPAGWPRTEAAKRRQRSPFRCTFATARDELLAELRRLGAEHPVLSTNLPVRQDGLPYADAARRRIDDPGAAVYFQLHGRPFAMARDAYGSIHDNVRSLGLAIEHLRGIERHGGAHMLERAFAGYQALPAPVVGWRKVLHDPATRAEAEATYRRLARVLHPDAGGHLEDMAALNAAIAAAREALR